MRVLAALLPALLLGSASQLSATAPLGVFQTWGSGSAAPLSVVAGGLTVKVTATRCRVPAQNEGCSFKGASNQAIVSVSQPGFPIFRMTSDAQASFVRVAVVRLASGQARSEVVIDNQWGGSAGLTAVTVIEPVAGGFRAVPLRYRDGTELIGEVRMLARDLLNDGRPAFVLEAPGLNFSGECYACAPGLPLVLAVRDGRSVDISGDPAVRSLFARDLPARRRVCISGIEERNGNCAAFVADAARLGQVASAWRVMLSHYRHKPSGYPAALRAFLLRGGYITPAQGRALPLA